MKKIPFTLLLSPIEKAAWEAEAKSVGLTLAAYIRVTVNLSPRGTSIEPPLDQHRAPQKEQKEPSIEPPLNHHQINGESMDVEGTIGVSSFLPFVPVVEDFPTPEIEKRKTKTSPRPDPAFERFWEIWPRKDAKKPALQAWWRAKRERRLPPLEDLLSAVRRQTAAKDWPSQFTPLPATWLNQDRWEDAAEDYSQPRPPSPEARLADEVRRLREELGELGDRAYWCGDDRYSAVLKLYDRASGGTPDWDPGSVVDELRREVATLREVVAGMSPEELAEVEAQTRVFKDEFARRLDMAVAGGVQ